MSTALPVAMRNRLYHLPAENRPVGTERASVLLKGFSADPKRLQAVTLLFVGLGSVGARMFVEAARLGVGRLIACDPGCYGPLSVWTQPMLPSDVGRAKAEVQAEAAHRTNPACEVITFSGFCQNVPRCLLRGCDALLIAGDNVDALVWASRVALELRIPLIEAVVYGDEMIAYVRRYDLRISQSPCPACGLREVEWQTRKSRHGCSLDADSPPDMEPTRTLPTTCDVAANMGLSEVIKQILGNETELLCGEEVAYCLKTHQIWRTRFERNDRCRLSHRSVRQVDVSDSLDVLTLKILMRRVHGKSSVPGHVKAETPWFGIARCSNPSCEIVTKVGRFARLSATVGTCQCGAAVLAGIDGRHSVIPPDDFERYQERPLSELGLKAGDTLQISADDDRTVVYLEARSIAEWIANQSR